MAEKLSTEIRKNQIITAAIKIIQTEGFKALTIQKIADQIGIVPSNVYRHFINKDQIINGILDNIQFRLHKNFKSVQQQYSSPLKALKAILMNQVKMMIQVSSIFPRILLSDEVFVNSPKRKEKVYSIFNSYLQVIDKIIERGQKQKMFRDDISSRSLSVMFFGLFQPSAFFYLLSNGNFNIEKQAEEAWKVFSQTLMP